MPSEVTHSPHLDTVKVLNGDRGTWNDTHPSVLHSCLFYLFFPKGLLGICLELLLISTHSYFVAFCTTVRTHVLSPGNHLYSSVRKPPIPYYLIKRRSILLILQIHLLGLTSFECQLTTSPSTRTNPYFPLSRGRQSTHFPDCQFSSLKRPIHDVACINILLPFTDPVTLHCTLIKVKCLLF